MRLLVAAVCSLAAAAGPVACGEGSSANPTIKVSAAASLKDALERYAQDVDGANPSFSFAGSDELAAQIRGGARPDVFAAANTKLPDELNRDGLVETPVEFATNELVIAVPAEGGGGVTSLFDLAQDGVAIAAGAASVPVGAYARRVIARLPPDQAARVLGNIRSNEPDVAGVLGKLSQGAVDAGFVYITDVKAAGGRLRAVRIPPRLQPAVVYGAAVVKGAPHSEQAHEFVNGLTGSTGRAALRAAGFGPPPG